MKIIDVVVLGGVAVAGYMVMKSTGGGGGTSPIRYITKVPQVLSPVEKPVTKEPQSVPMIINLPSESVTFPAPKLPSVTSLLPPIPSEEPKTPTVTAVTKTPAPTKKEKTVDYTKPSPESWREFTKEVWGAEPGKWSKKTGGTTATYEEVKRFGFPAEYTNWLSQKSEIISKPAFYQSMWSGKGGGTSKTTKKEQKVIPEKESETKVKPKFYQSMWSGKTKTKPAKTTTKKETKEKKPPALPGITWKRSGSGWIPVRS